MAKLFTHPEQEDYLKHLYLWELWTSLLELAPTCMAYLREQGVDAWLERYGLPEGLRDWAEEYHADPQEYVPAGWDRQYELPFTVRLTWHWEPFPEYDPTRMPRHRWRAKAIAWLESYMQAVEDVYKQAGWVEARIKYNPEHFTWLALRLEGLSWGLIADKEIEDGKPPTGEDTVRKAVIRLAQQIGVDI